MNCVMPRVHAVLKNTITAGAWSIKDKICIQSVKKLPHVRHVASVKRLVNLIGLPATQ